MPSDTPKEGRCGAKVTSKVGLEVHDSELDMVFVDSGADPEDAPKSSDVAGEGDDYDDEIVEVVLADGDHTQNVDPTWDDVLPQLRNGWHVQSVIVRRESQDAIEHVVVDIDDDDPYVTNRTSRLDGFCLRYPMDNGTCYAHQGGPGEGNTSAIKHGMYVERSKFMQWLEDQGRDDDIRFIHAMVDSWLDDAPFDRDNTAKVNDLYRAATDCLRLWLASDEYVTKGDGDDNPEGEYSGLAYNRIIGVTDDGDPIEVLEESPINLPYSRLERDVQQKLTKMGIYDSPEQQQAEAGKSLAQALSGSDNE